LPNKIIIQLKYNPHNTIICVVVLQDFEGDVFQWRSQEFAFVGGGGGWGGGVCSGGECIVSPINVTRLTHKYTMEQ